jgi:toxin secretion/phage lysis holin
MTQFFDRWAHASQMDIPATLKLLSVVLAPLFSFFDVNLLLGLMAFLFIDFGTGIYKAKLLKKLASTRFGHALDRAVYYLVVYAVLHTLTLVLPFGPMSAFFETAVLTGYVLKEALSILENLRVIRTLRGQETVFIDALVDRLGMDLERLTRELQNAKLPTLAESLVQRLDFEPAPDAQPAPPADPPDDRG